MSYQSYLPCKLARFPNGNIFKRNQKLGSPLKGVWISFERCLDFLWKVPSLMLSLPQYLNLITNETNSYLEIFLILSRLVSSQKIQQSALNLLVVLSKELIRRELFPCKYRLLNSKGCEIFPERLGFDCTPSSILKGFLGPAKSTCT